MAMALNPVTAAVAEDGVDEEEDGVDEPDVAAAALGSYLWGVSRIV